MAALWNLVPSSGDRIKRKEILPLTLKLSLLISVKGHNGFDSSLYPAA
jgi:hypothetical protein